MIDNSRIIKNNKSEFRKPFALSSLSKGFDKRFSELAFVKGYKQGLFFAVVMLLLGMASAQDTGGVELKTKPVSEGKCLHFDGIDDVVNAGDINALDSSQYLTTEMWVRIDKFDAWRTFFCKFKNLGNRIQFQQFSEPGKIAVVVNNGANIEKEGNQAYYYTPGPEVTIGDWFHLAMVFDGTLAEEDRLKIYINGMIRPLKKEAASKGAVPAYMPSTNAPLLLGAEKVSGAYGFKGMMDEIRIWTKARSAEEIRNNMERQLTGSEEGLRLYYVVDYQSDSAKILIDKTSDNQHAKLSNFNLETCFIDREVSVPATAASAPKVEEPRSDGIRIAWVRGSGSANLVFATASENGLPQPEAGVTYVANPEYGKGSRIGETDWYCVYNGYESDVSITGLTPSSDYRLSVIDYNGAPGSEQYKSDSTATITITTAAEPVKEPQEIAFTAPAKKSQEIAFTLDSAVIAGSDPIALTASASSGLPVTIKSSDTAIAKITGTTLYVRAAGTVTITVSQAGDSVWLPANDATRVLVVNNAPELPSPKDPVTIKKVKPFLIGGAVVIVGAVIGIIAAVANGNDDGGGNTNPSNLNDRPPSDPIMGMGP